ncbi:MAG: nitric oxide synthase oxygenase [Saprospiraceae bacterium]
MEDLKNIPSDILDSAYRFLHQYFTEENLTGFESRMDAVRTEIAISGTYRHTLEELTFGARVAWRNNNRCIGRLFWNTLEVFDHRDIQNLDDAFKALEHHIRYATNNGKIRSAISIFPPLDALGRIPIEIKNSKLIRYAGFEKDGSVIGDPLEVSFTKKSLEKGWQGKTGPFSLLPVILKDKEGVERIFSFKKEDILEVKLKHPDYDWFEKLNLKWFALPVISDMILEIGGILYPTAPFNGWYMLTEIGTRNLADESRYNLLPIIAEKMGLNIKNNKSLWKDRALTELNQAVLYSFQEQKVTITDHHAAAKQFLKFEEMELNAGREVTGDWTWLVPPTAGSTTRLFHKEWKDEIKCPNYFYKKDLQKNKGGKCPFGFGQKKSGTIPT